MQLGGGNPFGVAGSSGVDNALDMLRDLLVWKLPPTRWELVGETVARLEAALAAGDAAGLHDATVDLELAGPTRISRLGDSATLAPEPVRQVANRLIHTLSSGGGSSPERGKASGPQRS
jgi:hypothetical protein